jgi:hypothetical protein
MRLDILASKAREPEQELSKSGKGRICTGGLYGRGEQARAMRSMSSSCMMVRCRRMQYKASMSSESKTDPWSVVQVQSLMVVWSWRGVG